MHFIPGAWRSGQVGIANAPGAGMTDDKVVYAFVPQIIHHYLDQEPILANVPSYLCMRQDPRDHVLNNLDKLAVKTANESGGYGMLTGSRATAQERAKFAELIRADPRNYMAQPTLGIPTAPTLVDVHLAPRHLDLRPVVLQSDRLYTTTGGLARVRWWSTRRRTAAASTPGSSRKGSLMLARASPRPKTTLLHCSFSKRGTRACSRLLTICPALPGNTDSPLAEAGWESIKNRVNCQVA